MSEKTLIDYSVFYQTTKTKNIHRRKKKKFVWRRVNKKKVSGQIKSHVRVAICRCSVTFPFWEKNLKLTAELR